MHSQWYLWPQGSDAVSAGAMQQRQMAHSPPPPPPPPSDCSSTRRGWLASSCSRSEGRAFSGAGRGGGVDFLLASLCSPFPPPPSFFFGGAAALSLRNCRHWSLWAANQWAL